MRSKFNLHYPAFMAILAVLSCICVLTTGCVKVSLSGNKKPDQPPQGQQPQGQQPAPAGQAQPGSLSGYWNVAFQFKDKTLKSSMQLTQQGNTFSGSGTDDHNSAPFTIEQGTITNNQISFYKKYAKGGAIQYNGTISQVNEADYKGPYMQGEYVTTINNEIVQNQWEAEMQPQEASQPPSGNPPAGNDPAQPETPVQSEQPPPEQPPANVDPNRAPHLSGKWNVGYEFNFKTIHSVMYLEQDGGRITGHGIDLNTKEKFTIPRGWYRFPKVTLIRKYKKGKDAAADREMIFKAQVSIVNDKDYSGPYFNGKTQGGGNWEGQMFK